MLCVCVFHLLSLQYTTIEYTLNRTVPYHAPTYLFVVDTCVAEDELHALKNQVTQVCVGVSAGSQAWCKGRETRPNGCSSITGVRGGAGVGCAQHSTARETAVAQVSSRHKAGRSTTNSGHVGDVVGGARGFLMLLLVCFSSCTRCDRDF